MMSLRRGQRRAELGFNTQRRNWKRRRRVILFNGPRPINTTMLNSNLSRMYFFLRAKLFWAKDSRPHDRAGGSHDRVWYYVSPYSTEPRCLLQDPQCHF